MSVDTCERIEAAAQTLPNVRQDETTIVVEHGLVLQSISDAVPGWVLGVTAVLVCVMRLQYC